MKSNTIREVVRDTKALIGSGDMQLKDQENQLLITSICKRLNRSYKNSPKTVAAIIKYIEDHGYELRRIDCDHARDVLEKKKETLDNVSHKDLDNIRIICESMFAQVIRAA